MWCLFANKGQGVMRRMKCKNCGHEIYVPIMRFLSKGKLAYLHSNKDASYPACRCVVDDCKCLNPEPKKDS